MVRPRGAMSWGTARAVVRPTKGDPCFFDSNAGVYEFVLNEDKGQAMMNHLRKYTADGRLIEAFNTIVMKAK